MIMNYNNQMYLGNQPQSYSRNYGEPKIQPMAIIKWVFIIGIVMVVLMAGKKIYTFIKSILDSFLGGDSTTGNLNDEKDGIIGNQYDNTILGEVTNALSGNTAGTSGTAYTDVEKKKYPWKPLVDAVWEKQHGNNITYDERVVNRLANLTDEQFRQACYYWNSRYRKGEGNLSLYYFLKGEWGADAFAPVYAKYWKAFPPKGANEILEENWAKMKLLAYEKAKKNAKK